MLCYQSVSQICVFVCVFVYVRSQKDGKEG